MDYQETLAFIHSRLTFGVKPGLDRTRELCRRLGNPQDRLRFVHVAGTNGKGSVCTMLSGILQEAGYRTGLYTSPYITDFCERMQTDGAPIEQDALCRLMEQVRPIVEQMDEEGDAPTEFEVITAAAFLWFEQTKCDVVVLETGLGGRFDSTNVIKTPLVSVITSISLDHTRVLGDTVEQIAFEKCGILKPGGVTVTSASQPDEALGMIMRRAAEEQNRVHMGSLAAVEVLDEGLWGSRLRFGELSVWLPLAGRHQHDNFLIAVEAARVLNQRGLTVTDEQIQRGVEKVRFPARLELLGGHPEILLDGAHNPAGAKALRDVLVRFCKGRRIAAVIGMMEDKDVEQAVGCIAPLCRFVGTVPVSNPRAMAPEKLAAIAAEHCPDSRAFQSRTEALRAAADAAGEDGVAVICGSLYLAGDIRAEAIRFAQNRHSF